MSRVRGRLRSGRASRLVGSRTAALALAATLVLAAVPTAARADEALLPGGGDLGAPGLSADEVAQVLEPDLDPSEEGAAAPGDEPTGTELATRLDAYLDQAFPACGAPGAAIAVVDADGVRYLRCLGDVTSEHQTFLVGSLSKSMTAACVMRLVEEGLIDLDAPASRFAPDYGTPDSVTVRSLLNQTSGFGYYESLAGATVGDTQGSFSYANANYDLLGRIIEQVSGEDLGTFMRETLFDPLGMDDASAGSEPQRAPRAPGHRNWFGLAVADGFEHGSDDDAWGGPASGYVRASISDMAAYLRMYLNSGAGVLSASSVHQMVFSRVPDPASDTYYGMGWTTFSWGDGELVMSHDGQVENYVARMCVIPGRSLGVVVLADANDELGGNEALFSLADGVTSIAVGGPAEPAVDGEARVRAHVRQDLVDLLAVAACAGAIVLARRGRWLAMALLWLASAAVLLADLPMGEGMRPCDFCAFFPDQALVLAACGILVAVGAIAWAAGVLTRRRERRAAR